MKIQTQGPQQLYQVAQPCSVEIFLKLDQLLDKRANIQFQFPNSWSLVSGPSYTRAFQCADPKARHYVSVSATGDTQAVFELSIQNRHLYYPKGAVRHGRLFTAKLTEGNIPAGTLIRIGYENTNAPYVSETEEMWIRVNEEAPEHPPVLKTIAGSHEYFRVIVPSHAKQKKEFDVLLVSLDQFDNASSTAFKGETLSFMDGTVIAKDINFSGALRVPVKIAQAGVYRFHFKKTVSNAIKVDDSTDEQYWGDLHIHTKLSHDAQGTAPYTYAREVSGLDFAAVTDHWESLGPEGYRIVNKWAEEANIPEVFVTLPADERNPDELTGHHNVYFSGSKTMDRYQPIHDENDPSVNSFSRLQEGEGSEVMIIPHHTGIMFGDLHADVGSVISTRPTIFCYCMKLLHLISGCLEKNNTRKFLNEYVDWNAADDKRLRPVMEIYSHHGQSEVYNPQHLLAYENNRMRNPERRANTSAPGPFYAQDYWMQEKRIGVIASSDEHSGQGGRRHGGITAVFTNNLTREGIFKALRQRRCYATTGER
ncbi:MAG: DUF3604 domain-containing protein, partial [Candidatus Electrothrix sp. AR4]|nr:DUF3604 domain-containing protein [Candidatus Electrothrix sp. AR4]